MAYNHKPKFIVFTGESDLAVKTAKALERKLFDLKYKAYYLGLSNIMHSFTEGVAETKSAISDHDEQIKWLGELARFFTGSGQILISAMSNLDDYDIENLKILNSPNEILVINIGHNNFNKFKVDCNIEESCDLNTAVNQVIQILHKENIIPLEYYL